jgi:hydrogenase maturation protease
VIGYGNTLRRDDGVGWHAARRLAGDPRLARARVVAEHQLAPELAYDMSTAGLVILVDASTATPAGTISVRQLASPGAPGEDPAAAGSRAGPGATSHHVTPEVLLALARELYGTAPEAVTVSIGVADIGPGEGLSPLVAAAVPVVADTVARLVAEHAGRVAGEAQLLA